MPKWVNRMKQLSQSSQQAFKNRFLMETAEEAKTVANDIRFIMNNSGIKVQEELGFDDESLMEVEKFYRSSLKKSLTVQQPPTSLFVAEDFERQLALYLGQALVERSGGEWAEYQGKYHVVNPLTIKLPSRKYVDVFLFCTKLHEKSVKGSESGQALVCFIKDADRLSIP
ncbi:MAG: hypothetical protein CME32_25320 [Gimesia sp.]|nr:hypothetical protein [Gimesia sp.]